MKKCYAILVMLLVFGGAIRGGAATYDSQADWKAAVGDGVTVFHFSGPTEENGFLANDPRIDPSYSSQGVDFLPFTGTTDRFPMILRNQEGQIPYGDGDGLLTNLNSPNSLGDLEGRAIQFDFNREIRAVGLYFNGYPGGAGDGGYIAAYNAEGDLIEKVDVCAAGFGGIVSNQIIRHVDVVNTFDGDITFGIYDLQFHPVPEPSALALLLVAALGGLLWRRRSR